MAANIQAFNGQGSPTSERFTECCQQIWCRLRVREALPEPVCANKVRNAPASANQGCSIKAKAAFLSFPAFQHFGYC